MLRRRAHFGALLATGRRSGPSPDGALRVYVAARPAFTNLPAPEPPRPSRAPDAARPPQAKAAGGGAQPRRLPDPDSLPSRPRNAEELRAALGGSCASTSGFAPDVGRDARPRLRMRDDDAGSPPIRVPPRRVAGAARDSAFSTRLRLKREQTVTRVVFVTHGELIVTPPPSGSRGQTLEALRARSPTPRSAPSRPRAEPPRLLFANFVPEEKGRRRDIVRSSRPSARRRAVRDA